MAQNRKSFGYPLRSTSTMAAPSALVLKCPQCGEVVPHRVLRGKIGGKDEIVFEGVVRCSKCDAISNVVTREPKPISVPLVVSWLDRSEKTSLEFSPDEDVSVGEELDLGDTRISVTAIESKGRRVGAEKARWIDTGEGTGSRSTGRGVRRTGYPDRKLCNAANGTVPDRCIEPRCR